MKQRLVQHVVIDPRSLPYHQPLLDFLHEQKKLGRQLVLATGAHQINAQKVADHLGLFDQVIACDGKNNCTGLSKVKLIREHLETQAFDYVGNSTVDLIVWRAATDCLVVSRPRGVVLKMTGNIKPVRVFDVNHNQYTINR